MENHIQVLGNESSVIYYNLNKQFSTIKKLIITKEIILNSYENSEFRELILKLKETNPQTFHIILNENKEVLESNLISELYRNIQEELNKLSNGYMDVKLKDYNFMSSVSNSKFNVTLRTESFSITNYYVEKGTILSNIKNIIKEYINFNGNMHRLPTLDNFQIEITESEEIYKQVFLKKENNSLILSASFGFPKNNPIDYTIGCEYYVSQGTDFKFFKNKQNSAIIREHNKLVEKEIQVKDKILSNENLVLINEKTKNIDDALIECYLTQKNQFRIVNVSLIENSLGNYSDNGFVINKSRNNYDRISIIGIRDNIDEDTVNPKYLLLKNDSEVKELMTELDSLNKIDGIIITQNFYSPYLEKLSLQKNIDVIFIDKQIQKSLEEKIDWQNLDIENSSRQGPIDNPFAGIITEQNKEKDELLERLKNLDLTTSKREQNTNNGQIEGLVNGIIGSNNSSFNKQNNTNQAGNTMYNNLGSNGGKKSAIAMLADSVLNQSNNQKQPEPVQENNQMDLNTYNQEVQNPNQGYYNQNTQNQTQQDPITQQLSNMGNVFDMPMQPQPQMQQFPSQIPTQQQFAMPIPQTIQFNDYQNELTLNEELNSKPKIDIAKYENILATEILGTPSVDADAFFVDMNTISQVENGKIYYLTLSREEMQNPNLNYVLPIKLNTPDTKDCFLLINRLTDFFLIDKQQKNIQYFVNIHEIPDSIKEKFLTEIIEKVGTISLICSKTDLEIIKDKIGHIDRIKVKNIEDNEELDAIRKKILSFEKRLLMKNN